VARVISCLRCGNVFMVDSKFCRKCGEPRLELDQLVNDRRFHFRYREYWNDASAIHVAACAPGGSDAIQILCEYNADIEDECIWSSGQSSMRLRPLHFAAGCGNCDTIDRLLHMHADIEAKMQLKRSSAHGHWEEHYTALHEACFFCAREVVEYLLSRRANPNSADVLRTTPLHLAAKQGNTRIAKLLLSSGADTQARDTSKLRSTPLAVAVDHGRFPHRDLHLLARRFLRIYSSLHGCAHLLLRSCWRRLVMIARLKVLAGASVVSHRGGKCLFRTTPRTLFKTG